MLLRMTYNMGALRRVSTTHLGERAVGGNIESSLKRYVKGRMRREKKAKGYNEYKVCEKQYGTGGQMQTLITATVQNVAGSGK